MIQKDVLNWVQGFFGLQPQPDLVSPISWDSESSSHSSPANRQCLEADDCSCNVFNYEEIESVSVPVSPVVSPIEITSFSVPVPQIVHPIEITGFVNKSGLRGIQGHRNSCYMDVCLFSMFAFTDVFDSRFLYKSPIRHYYKKCDTSVSVAARAHLSQIVNELRSNYYCSASIVNPLRELMIPLNSKLDGAFMDVEEFLLLLFQNVFNLEDFIYFDNNTKDYLYQINLSSFKLPRLTTVQSCFEFSLQEYGLKLKGIPSPALILQMPRDGGQLIQSTTIIPNLTIDLAGLIDDAPSGISTKMELLAVICYKEHHYVTFVRSGEGKLSHWVYFNSKPSDGVPRIEMLPMMGEQLSGMEEFYKLNPGANSEEILNKVSKPEYNMLKTLLSDIYVCIYYSPEAAVNQL